jgi:hypothetical protein
MARTIGILLVVLLAAAALTPAIGCLVSGLPL